MPSRTFSLGISLPGNQSPWESVSLGISLPGNQSPWESAPWESVSLGISSQGISSLGISSQGISSLGISSLGINESQRPKKFRFLPRTSDHKTKKTEANTTTQNLPLVRPTGKNERTTHLLGLRFFFWGSPAINYPHKRMQLPALAPEARA